MSCVTCKAWYGDPEECGTSHCRECDTWRYKMTPQQKDVLAMINEKNRKKQGKKVYNLNENARIKWREYAIPYIGGEQKK